MGSKGRFGLMSRLRDARWIPGSPPRVYVVYRILHQDNIPPGLVFEARLLRNEFDCNTKQQRPFRLFLLWGNELRKSIRGGGVIFCRIRQYREHEKRGCEGVQQSRETNIVCSK